MYKGKHLKPSSSRKKPVLLLTSLILLVTLSVSGTLAYLIASTSSVKNTFSAATVPIQVNEVVTDGVKNDVTIENIGSADAYIRAAVVANWVSTEDNSVYGAMIQACTDPTCDHGTCGKDYAISWTQENWEEFPLGSGYYYYTEKVSPDQSTEELFTGCEPITTKDGYTLSVEVLAQSIQADGQDSDGNTPVELAWGVTISSSGVSAADTESGT